jgi:hypothetical protein
MPDADGDIEARAWVATAHGDPTAVMEQQTIPVRVPGPNGSHLRVDVTCDHLTISVTSWRARRTATAPCAASSAVS